MKVVRLSALRTGRLYSPGNIPGTHFCWRLSQPQSHRAAGRIVSMKNSNDTIGNRTRNLPACSALPQPTAPPRHPEQRKANVQNPPATTCNLQDALFRPQIISHILNTKLNSSFISDFWFGDQICFGRPLKNFVSDFHFYSWSD